MQHTLINWQSDPELTSFKTQGLDFITSWILTGQFEENLDLSLRGSKHHLDDFVTHRTSNKKLIAFPRGIVTHWLAGNVPTLGIISLMISIACKNANLVKVSKTSLRVLQKMMSMMADIEVTNLSGRRL